MQKKGIEPPAGKKFYGSVTVSERGQIVVPADARKDFHIQTGDKLLVFGDLEQGLWITPFATIQKLMTNSAYFFEMVQSKMDDKPGAGNRDLTL